MILKFFIITILAVLAGNQRRYVSLVGFLLLFSLGPLLKITLNIQSTGSLYILYFGLFFARLLMTEYKRLSRHLIYFILVVLVLLILQLLRNDLNIDSFILGISRFIFLPVLALYAVKDLLKYKVDPFSIFIVYLFINYFVFYMRAFYDYSFFGALDTELNMLTYRPSNLSNPIVFSIEVAIFISLMLRSNVSSAYKIIISVTSIIPLIFMHSRSSYMIIALNYFFLLLYTRRYGTILSSVLLLSVIILIFFYTTGDIPYILTVFDYSGGAYGQRFSSMSGTVSLIANMDIIDFLVGFGSGAASQHGASHGMDVIYVENAFISLIVENGIVVLMCYLLSLAYYPFKTGLRGDSAYLYMILVSIWLINLFAASLTVLSVQLLYWTMYFYGLLLYSSVTEPLVRNSSYSSLES